MALENDCRPNGDDTRSRNWYQKLAPSRTQLYSVQVSGTSFLSVCHLYKPGRAKAAILLQFVNGLTIVHRQNLR